jgi:hypothetical protein
MNENISQMLQYTVNKMSGDMKFVGVFYMILGVLYCLTIVGAVIGIPFIICGIRLRESADSFNMYISTNDGSMLERAIERQSKFFFIQKVLMIIALALIILYIILIFVFGVALMGFFSEFNNGY